MTFDSVSREIDAIFVRAAKSALVSNSSDAIVVEPYDAAKSHAMPGERALVLTISSYRFRLLIIFHFTDNIETRRSFHGAEKGIPLDDILGEVGNLCCGSIKHELGRSLPHIGLSTPYVLENRASRHIDSLKPTHVSRHRILLNHTSELHASLCLCAYGPFALAAPNPEPTAVESGTLELF